MIKVVIEDYLGRETNDNQKFQGLRDNLQRDVNSRNLIPFDGKVFQKTSKEKGELKFAKEQYKALQLNQMIYKQTKNQLLEIIVKSTPNWGSGGLRI